MRITSNEVELLLQATQGLGRKYQKVAIELLSSLCESHDWFHQYLFFVFKKGVVITHDSIESMARYNFPNKQMIINTEFLPTSSLSTIPPVITNILKLALRHELTHAFDAQQNVENLTERNVLAERLHAYQSVANSLYNALTCVDKYYQVNRKKLNELASILNQSETDIGSYPAYDNKSPIDRVIKAQVEIDLLGYSNDTGILNGKMMNFPRYVTKILQLNDNTNYVMLATRDYTRIRNLFDAAKPYREQNNEIFQAYNEAYYKTYNETIINTLNDARQLSIWNNLSAQQRAALDTLYMLRARLHSNIINKDACFPKLNECVIAAKMDCFDDFFVCQEHTNKDNVVVSYFEVHAVLREYTQGYLLTENMLDQLCPLPVVMLDSDKTTIPKQIPRKTAPGKPTQQPKKATTSSSAWRNGLNSFGFSLVDEMAQAFFEANEFNNIPLWKTLINIAYILFSYSFLNFMIAEEKEEVTAAWQISLSIAFILIRNGLDFASENSAVPQMGVWPKRMFTTSIFASQAFFEGPGAMVGSIVTGTVGSTIGDLCAHSLSQALGWQSLHKIISKRMQNILSNCDKPRENYQPFIKAVQEKHYSKALRIACTSTDSTALSFVQLLLEYKEKLAINISEQAGADNRSALHHAALKNNKAAYYLLLQHRAIDIEDGHDVTAEQYLIKYEEQQRAAIASIKPQ